MVAAIVCPQVTQAYTSIKSESNEAAPTLKPILNLSLNFRSINSQYSHRNGILVAELLSYIERLYEGRQFSTTSSEFLLNKSQFGIAITDIVTPHNVEGLLTVGGNNFLYRLNNSPYKGLARMIEPHQKISFRSYTSSRRERDYEVKIKFRLWDLREREQLSPFSWYRLDNVGGHSPFSSEEQEITIKMTSIAPNREKPFWDENQELKDFYIDLENSGVFQMKVKDLLKGADGEIILRDKSNRPLGLKFLNWNSPMGKFYYRYDTEGPWTELQGTQTYLYLGLSAEIKIEFDAFEIHKHKSIRVQGWDGLEVNGHSYLTKKIKNINFKFY